MTASNKLAVSIDQLSFFSGLLILRGSASNIGRQISSVYVEIGDFGCSTLYNHPAIADDEARLSKIMIAEWDHPTKVNLAKIKFGLGKC
jgi:hypothetical protein